MKIITDSTLGQQALERVGEVFDRRKMLDVRDMTRAAVHEIAARVLPGMLEADAVVMAKQVLNDRKMLRGWHGVFVRFGKNTTKTYGADSEPNVRLGSNDIFFIDIGPVFEKWEGDGGATFVVGHDAGKERCATDAEGLFHIVRRKWLADGITGAALYAFAREQANARNWQLNMDLSGHRLAEFPHAAYYAGTLADVDFSPSPLLWVLEIHIRDPKQEYGAFFEDMLLDDSYFPQLAAGAASRSTR